MRTLTNPWYGTNVSVPEELADLLEAIWQSGFDARVTYEFDHDVCVRAPAEGMERFLHHLLDLNFMNSPVYRFYIISAPRMLPQQLGQLPDPFAKGSSLEALVHQSPEHEDAEFCPRLGRMVCLIADALYLPVLTACAQWMAGGPKPEMSEGHSLGRCVLCGDSAE
jgi:hypothetical protein